MGRGEGRWGEGEGGGGGEVGEGGWAEGRGERGKRGWRRRREYSEQVEAGEGVEVEIEGEEEGKGVCGWGTRHHAEHWEAEGGGRDQAAAAAGRQPTPVRPVMPCLGAARALPSGPTGQSDGTARYTFLATTWQGGKESTGQDRKDGRRSPDDSDVLDVACYRYGSRSKMRRGRAPAASRPGGIPPRQRSSAHAAPGVGRAPAASHPGSTSSCPARRKEISRRGRVRGRA